MGVVVATDRDGSEHRLAGRQQASLMEILRQAGLSVEALCGGSCMCATCHVYVHEDWLGKLDPPLENEQATLEEEGIEARSNSRLACQIRWREELDGIRITVAPGG